MKIAILMTDNREMFKKYAAPSPEFGTAPEALLQGFGRIPGIEVHVISCVRKPVQTPKQLGSNLYAHALIVPKIGWLSTAYQGCIRAVRQCINQIEPDIVHGQGTERDNGMTAAFSGRPNVITIHGNMVDIAQAFKARPGSYHWFAARLETLALRSTSGVVCNSAYTQRRVHERTRKTWRVPNAVRLAFFEEPRATPRRARPTLLHIGTVCRYKQQLEMLDLAYRLKAQGLDFELWFIGNADPADDYAQDFCRRIKEAEQQGFARYLGSKSLSEMIKHLDQARALVHTPTVEAFGLVVAEALARGLKFFGLNVGGVPDIVQNIPEAVLVQPGDWPLLEQEIAIWLREGSPLPQATSTLIRERYHPETVAHSHLEVYREILGIGSRVSRAKDLGGTPAQASHVQ